MHHTIRRLIRIALIVTTLGAAASAPAIYAQDQSCFAETRLCISGCFRQYWEQNGGLAVFGFPITPPQEERNRDTGQSYVTQWFERNRFELHPENSPPYDVLLGRLGNDRLLQSGRVWQQEAREAGPQSGCLWFEQTGHNVCNQTESLGFKSYWQGHGLADPKLDSYARSLALFGLPLTAPRMETNTSGDTVLTQWFERARLEWHPGKPDQYKVLLGLLGNDLRTPPTASAFPEHLVAFRDRLFFSADDGKVGRELWQNDGTDAGTTLVKDIYPGPEFSTPVALTVVGDTLFFAASSPETGTELWRTDGTTAGTVLVKDIPAAAGEGRSPQRPGWGPQGAMRRTNGLLA